MARVAANIKLCFAALALLPLSTLGAPVDGPVTTNTSTTDLSERFELPDPPFDPCIKPSMDLWLYTSADGDCSNYQNQDRVAASWNFNIPQFIHSAGTDQNDQTSAMRICRFNIAYEFGNWMGDAEAWEFGAIKLAFYFKAGFDAVATYGPAAASPPKDHVYPGPSDVGPNYNTDIAISQDDGTSSVSTFVFAWEVLNDQCKG